MKTLLVCFLCLLGFSSVCQSNIASFDSLKNLSFSYPDSVIQIVKGHLAENEDLQKNDKAHYYLLISIALRNAGDFKAGLKYADSAIAIDPSEKIRANSYHNKGVCYRFLGDYDSAIYFNLEALKGFETLGLVKEQAVVMNSLGVVNMKAGDYPKALYYYNKTLEMQEGEEDVDNLSDVLNNIAIIYANTGKLDSSAIYFRKSLAFEMKVNNLKGISAGYNNLGALQYYLGDLDSAIFYFRQSLRIDKQMNDKQGIPAVMSNIAEVAIQNKDYRMAKAYLDTCIVLSKEIGSKRELENAYLNMAGLFQAKGDFEQAFENLLTSKAYADSLVSEEKNKAIAEWETKYETEKKEQQIALQDLQLAEQKVINQRNQILLASTGGIIVLLVLIGFQGHSRLKWKNRQLLEEQKRLAREAEMNAVISSQEKERNRFARDLHDGFGQLISTLNLNLKNLNNPKDKAERERVFDASAKVLDEMYQELKNICFDLMPQTLIRHGLEAALNEFANRINVTGQKHVEVNVFGLEERLTDLQEISLYRVAQEWVNNILKYSDAQKIVLQVTKDADEVTLLIEDDGAGFDQAKLTQGKGNGWRNITSRANLIHGELEIDTQPGAKGTTLILNATLQKEQQPLEYA